MSQTERLYWLDDQIRNRRHPNAATVAQQFPVTERTAYADVRHLKGALNAPLVFDTARGGYVYTDPTYRLPFLLLTDGETAALRRSLLLAREYAPAPADAEPLRLLAERLGASVPEALPTPRERARGSVHLSSALSPDLLDACNRAVAHRHRLRLLYYTAGRGEVAERVVRPHALLNWRGEAHVVAWCEWRQDFRQFFLGRIRDWELLEPEAAFGRDPAFDVDEYLSRGLDLRHGEVLVTVRVRFDAYQARWIRERRYHESQQNEEQEDGGLIVTLHVAGTEEIRRWVSAYGIHAEVLEPESLRREMAAQAKKLAEMYADAPD